jgi:hypothetical protein
MSILVSTGHLRCDQEEPRQLILWVCFRGTKAFESDVSSSQVGNWLSREVRKPFRHVAGLLVDAMQCEVTGSLKCQKPLFRN